MPAIGARITGELRLYGPIFIVGNATLRITNYCGVTCSDATTKLYSYQAKYYDTNLHSGHIILLARVCSTTSGAQYGWTFDIITKPNSIIFFLVIQNNQSI